MPDLRLLALMAIEDVTAQRRIEHEHAAAHEHIAVLLQELSHRIKKACQGSVLRAYPTARLTSSSVARA
jgi:two-component sensor histidine kinase